MTPASFEQTADVGPMSRTPARVGSALALAIVALAFVVDGHLRAALLSSIGLATIVLSIWRLRRGDIVSGYPVWVVFGFMASALLIGDVLTSFDAGMRAAPFPTLADSFHLLGFALCCGMTLWTAHMRGPRRDLASALDGTIFIAALFAPGWALLIAPAVDAGNTNLVIEGLAFGAAYLAMMGIGGRFMLSGGIWNAPAFALTASVIAITAVDFGIRAAHAQGVLDADSPAFPHFFVGYALWIYTALHADSPLVEDRGYRPDGMPLGHRLLLLAMAGSLPLLLLAVSYVQGWQVESWTILVGLGGMMVVLLFRARMLARQGLDAWHAPVFIGVATMLVLVVAGGLVALGTAAGERETTANRLSRALHISEALDIATLRSDRGSFAQLASGHRLWRAGVRNLERAVREAAASSDGRVDADNLLAYVSRYADETDEHWDDIVAARTSPAAAARARDATDASTSLHAALIREESSERHAAEAASRNTRLATVAALGFTLAIVVILLLRSATLQRKAELRRVAALDGLTGVSSRDALEGAARARHDDSGGAANQALILLDLDDFKAINDSFGHPAGNALLRDVAERLQAVTRANEILARLDGDTYALLVSGPRNADEAQSSARRVAECFDEPFKVAGSPHQISASIGVALTAVGLERGDDCATVLRRNAELAMYEAKSTVGTHALVFAPEMHEAVRNRTELATDLRSAIADDELHLVYQPIIDLATERTVGYEALVRWTHPVRGPLSPMEFIPIAERTGLIIELGAWVLHTATRQMQAWQAEFPEPRYVSVNVAGAQLQSGALSGQVRAALSASRLPADLLLLEVTESSLIEHMEFSEEIMADVRQLGARFALDDFGTGYSSLSYLRRFPVQVLKIDKSFIDDVTDQESGGPLVHAIVNMAASLRLSVVAEGIEHDVQAEMLRGYGCDLAQGYRFSRPLNVDDVLPFQAPGDLRAAEPFLRLINKRTA